MDWNLLLDFLKLAILLPVIIFLIYITLKYGSKYSAKFNTNKIIKVIERVPLGQNTYISVVTIGDKPYVISSGDKGAQILLELDEKLFEDCMKDKSQNNVNIEQIISKVLKSGFKGKVKDEKIQ